MTKGQGIGKICSLNETKFRYIVVLFHMFCFYWGKEIRSLIPSTSLHRGSLYRGSTNSSPGRFSLALEVGREKRPGDEVGGSTELK